MLFCVVQFPLSFIREQKEASKNKFLGFLAVLFTGQKLSAVLLHIDKCKSEKVVFKTQWWCDILLSLFPNQTSLGC